MNYLLYLIFRCDRRCDRKFGKFGNFVGTKHTLCVKTRGDRSVSLSATLIGQSCLMLVSLQNLEAAAWCHQIGIKIRQTCMHVTLCFSSLNCQYCQLLCTGVVSSSSIWGLVIGLYLVSVAFRCHEKPARRGSDSSATETANDSSANHRCSVWPSYLGLLRPVSIAIDHQTGRP